MCIWVALKERQIRKDIVDNYKSMFESRISAGAVENYQKPKLPRNLRQTQSLHGLMTWKVMRSNAWNDIANQRKKQLNSYTKVATPCFDDHQFKKEEMGSVGELSKVCSQIVLTCLYLARICRPDILCSVNKLARAVTKWTKACDYRYARLISYIHHTSETGNIVM